MDLYFSQFILTPEDLWNKALHSLLCVPTSIRLKDQTLIGKVTQRCGGYFDETFCYFFFFKSRCGPVC